MTTSPALPTVGILMGSISDLEIMKGAKAALEHFEVSSELKVLSAHRTPEETIQYAKAAISQGLKVLIAGAGGAAHLPGVLAALTTLPVIGVPIAREPLQGQDALLSIVQMPKGIVVATVGINNSWNAGLLAAQILAIHSIELQDKLIQYKEQLRKEVLAKKIPPHVA